MCGGRRGRAYCITQGLCRPRHTFLPSCRNVPEALGRGRGIGGVISVRFLYDFIIIIMPNGISSFPSVRPVLHSRFATCRDSVLLDLDAMPTLRAKNTIVVQFGSANIAVHAKPPFPPPADYAILKEASSMPRPFIVFSAIGSLRRLAREKRLTWPRTEPNQAKESRPSTQFSSGRITSVGSHQESGSSDRAASAMPWRACRGRRAPRSP